MPVPPADSRRPSHAPHFPPTPIRSSIMLDDLLADLLWPRLLRAPVLALSPGRVILAAFVILVGVVLLSILAAFEAALGWTGSPEMLERWSQARSSLFSVPDFADPGAAATAWMHAVLALPGVGLRAHPLVGSLGSIVVIVLWCIGGGALARSCVCELGGSIRCSWTEALAYAASRASSLLGALLIPLVLVTIAAFACSLAGLVLLRPPGVNLIGSLLFGLLLIVGFLAVMVLALYVAGHILLIPAVAADGSDAVDAIQRAYAYILGRPARFVIYLAIAVAQGLVVIGIALAIAAGVRTFTASATSRWAGDDARTMIAQAHAAAIHGPEAERAVLRAAATEQAVAEERPLPAEEDATPDRLFTFAWGARIIETWLLLVGLLLAGFVATYVHAAGSIIYLLLRRLNDGQDISEIWRPRAASAPGLDAARAEPAVSEAVGDVD